MIYPRVTRATISKYLESGRMTVLSVFMFTRESIFSHSSVI